MSVDVQLIGIAGDVISQKIPLGLQSCTIGRSPDCSLPIPSDQSLSQNHAQIFQKAGLVFIVDLGSSNGTRVNGKLIDSPSKLSNGDRIETGAQAFEISISRTHVGSRATSRGNTLKAFVGCFFLIFIIVVLGLILKTAFRPTPDSAEITARAIHQWFQENLDDADSVQLVSVYDAPPDLQVPGADTVLVSFRAKNGFGAYRLVRDEVMVIQNGRVVKAESQEELNQRNQANQLDQLYDRMYGGKKD